MVCAKSEASKVVIDCVEEFIQSRSGCGSSRPVSPKSIARSSRNHALVVPTQFRDVAFIVPSKPALVTARRKTKLGKSLQYANPPIVIGKGLASKSRCSISCNSSGASYSCMPNNATTQQKPTSGEMLKPFARTDTCLFNLCHLKLR